MHSRDMEEEALQSVHGIESTTETQHIVPLLLMKIKAISMNSANSPSTISVAKPLAEH